MLAILGLTTVAGADSLDVHVRRTQTLRPAEPTLVGHASMATRRAAPHLELASGSRRGYVEPSFMGGPWVDPDRFQTVKGPETHAWNATISGVESGDRVRLETQAPSAPLHLRAQRFVAAHIDEELHLHSDGRSLVAAAHGHVDVDVDVERVHGGAAVSALARQGRLMSIRSALRAAQRWNTLHEERADLPEVERDAFGPKHLSPPYQIDRQAQLAVRTPVRVTVDDKHGRRQFVRTATVGGGATRIPFEMEQGEAYWAGDGEPVRWRVGQGGPYHPLYQEAVSANRHLGVRLFLYGKVGGGAAYEERPIWTQTENIWATPAYVNPKTREGVATIVGLAALPVGSRVVVVNHTLSERVGGSVESETTVKKRSGSFVLDVRAPVAGCKYSIHVMGPGEPRSFDFTLPEADATHGASLRELNLKDAQVRAK